MDKFGKELTDTMEQLIAAMVKTDGEEYNDFSKRVLKVMDNSPYDFSDPDVFHTMFSFQLGHMMEELAKTLSGQPDSFIKDKFKPRFIFLHYQFLESNIKKLIDMRTVTGCISDKTRFIIKMYLNYSLTGEIPETDTEEHFWIPKFGTNEEWMSFCDGLYKLFYGDNKLYLSSYTQLLNAEVRKYSHTLYTLKARFKNGNIMVIDERYDEPVLLPSCEDGFYIIPKRAFEGTIVYYEQAGADIPERFFYKVPENEILNFEAKTETITV